MTSIDVLTYKQPGERTHTDRWEDWTQVTFATSWSWPTLKDSCLYLKWLGAWQIAAAKTCKPSRVILQFCLPMCHKQQILFPSPVHEDERVLCPAPVCPFFLSCPNLNSYSSSKQIRKLTLDSCPHPSLKGDLLVTKWPHILWGPQGQGKHREWLPIFSRKPSIQKPPPLSGSYHCGLFWVCSQSYQIRARTLSRGSQEKQRKTGGSPGAHPSGRCFGRHCSSPQAILPSCHLSEPFYSWAPGHLEWRHLFEVRWSMWLSSGWWNTSKKYHGATSRSLGRDSSKLLSVSFLLSSARSIKAKAGSLVTILVYRGHFLLL